MPRWSSGRAMNLNAWARKNLRRGDLTALSHIARRDWVDPQSPEIDRLAERGFVVKKANGAVRIKIKGRVALFVRRPKI